MKFAIGSNRLPSKILNIHKLVEKILLGLYPEVPVTALTLSEVRRLDVEVDELAGLGHPASTLRPGTTSPELVAVVGEDGYFFIANGSNFWEDQYLGRYIYDDSFFSSWLLLLENRQALAKQNSLELWNLVVPEKQVLFPEKRWPTGPRTGSDRPMMRLRPYLTPSCNLIYPENEMRALLQSVPTHSRHDSHWTPSGCGVAVQTLLDAVNAGPDLESVSLNVGRHPAAADLTRHFFIHPPVEDMVSFGPNGNVIHEDLRQEITGSFTGSTYALQNENAADQRRVVVFGDSYSFTGGITYLLSAIFRTVYFCWSKDVQWSFALECSADIIIWEHAERYITSIPRH